MYAYNAKSELKEYDGVEKSEQKAEESIGERVKLRRQKADELNKMITEKENINFKVYLICRKHCLKNRMKNRATDLNNETRKISKNEKANEILDIVSQIIDFNKQYQDGQ